MVGMPGENLLGAVELFQKHAAGKEVRPGHRAERNNRVGPFDDHRSKSFRATDRERQRGYTLIAPGTKSLREIAARPPGALFIERDKTSARGHRGKDQFGLSYLQLRRRQFAFLLEFDDCRRRVQAAGIECLQLTERAAALLADGKYHGADG